MSFGARALIRLGALKHNLNAIRGAVPGAQIMAVIKANAYGHGMLDVARNLPDVDAFAVARPGEAIALRKAGIQNRIVVFSGVYDEAGMRTAVEYGIEPVVHCVEQIELFESTRGAKLRPWLKIDTGMSRLGIAADEAPGLIERLRDSPAALDVRLMTHLSSADERDNDETRRQLQRFLPLLESHTAAVSIANSPGALGWPELLQGQHRNWVRTGIALFGVSPFADVSADTLGLQPVMHFEAPVLATKPLLKGQRVGYGGTYQAPQDSTLGIVAAGYGDGYSRHFRTGTPVLLKGRQVPVVGRVSMDTIALDLGADATDRVGDIATLWGDGLPVEAVAPWADAIPYDLLCGVTHREPSKLID